MAAQGQEVILLSCGGFNPIHDGHLQMAILAAEAVREHGYVVSKIIFSPSHDIYVQKKVNRRGDSRIALSAKDRCRLIKSAIEGNEHLKDVGDVDTLECDQTRFVDHPRIRQLIEKREGKPVIFVAGCEHLDSDLAVRCQGWERSFPVVVVSRQGNEAISKESIVINAGGGLRNRVFRHEPEKMRFIVKSENDFLSQASSSKVAAGKMEYLPECIREEYEQLVKKHSAIRNRQ